MKKLISKNQKITAQLFYLAIAALSCISPLCAEVSYSMPLNAKEHQIGNMLEWSTDMEINSRIFEVQKSLDGIQFDNIGQIDAAGMTKNGKSYRFLDAGVGETKVFYRLKQIDMDGMTDLSQTVIVNKTIQNQFMVVAMSSTTFDKNFQLTVEIIEDITIEYDIYTLEGELIRQNKEELSYGLNDIYISLEDEKEGFYKIILRLNEEEENLIVMKTDDVTKKPAGVASQRKQKGG